MRNGTTPTLAKGWQWRKFGDCAQFINGRAYSQQELLDEGTPVLRIQNLNGGDRWYYSNLELPAEKYCEAGDLLFAWSASFGPYRFAGPKSIFHYHIWRVVPGAELDKAFAFRLLQEITAEVKSAAHGVAMLHMTKGGIEAWPIPLPPLAEQKRIAGILDAADALRAKRREALAQLDTLLQATFLDLFGDPVTNPKGWSKVRLPDVVYFQEGPGVRNWQFRDAGIKLINVRNIVDSELDLNNTERHLDTQEVKDKYSHFLLDEGDLVMSSSGVTWGKIAYVRREHLPLCLNTSMIRLRPARPTVVHSFIEAFVQSESFRRQMLRLITGSAQPNFGPSHLRQLEIGLPPLDLQRKFEAVVASVQSQRAAHRAHLAELDTLFASLQSRAFRGEL